MNVIQQIEATGAVVRLEEGLTAEAVEASPRAVVMLDSFMSGWGGAEGGRSFYVLLSSGSAESKLLLENAGRRDEMSRAREVTRLTPSAIRGSLAKLAKGDHVAIVTRDSASAWYQPGAFKG